MIERIKHPWNMTKCIRPTGAPQMFLNWKLCEDKALWFRQAKVNWEGCQKIIYRQISVVIFRDLRVFSLPNVFGGKLCEICTTACSLFRAQSDIYLRDVTVFPDPPVVRSIRFYCRHLCTHLCKRNVDRLPLCMHRWRSVSSTLAAAAAASALRLCLHMMPSGPLLHLKNPHSGSATQLGCLK